MTPLAEDRAEPIWFIKAQGRVWGPYPESRVEGFVAEGRVAATTLTATSADGPFSPAALQVELRRLFAPSVEPKPTSESYAAPRSAPHSAIPYETLQRSAAVGIELEPIEHAGLLRPLLVFAALASLEEPAFEAALAIHGPYVRIAAGLWLVKARLGPAALRNALSRRLRADDTLLVAEAPLDRAAWFNLDLAEERKLRTFWAG
jgi:hypothetical protein